MQPKRAEEFTGPWAEQPVAEPAAKVADGSAAAAPSPALLLREQLAQRIAGSAVVWEEPKLPVSLRIVVIAALASSCWAAIWLVVAQVL